MKYCISVQGPKLWNKLLQNKERKSKSYSLFQKSVKLKIIEIENDVMYFWNDLFIFLIITPNKVIFISQNSKLELRSRAW